MADKKATEFTWLQIIVVILAGIAGHAFEGLLAGIFAWVLWNFVISNFFGWPDIGILEPAAISMFTSALLGMYRASRKIG